MTSDRRVAVVVDAHHSSTQLVEEFSRRGVDCVHVKTVPSPRTAMFPALDEKQFLDVMDYDGQSESTADRLRQFEPFCVLPGSEVGVEVADALANELELPANGLENSRARRDKYLMAEAVGRAGLRIARQQKCSRPSQAVDWARKEKLSRTVVKPLHGAGTDSVFVCSHEADLKARVTSILGSKHHLGLENEEVLVQDFIEGREYVVNTVSWEGVHRVTGVWLYHKLQIPGVTSIYDWDELVHPRDEIVAILTEYTKGVLDALSIRFGPAHTEIMVDDEGPVLIESGARLDGLEYLPFARHCMGLSQIDQTCLAYMSSREFLEEDRSYFRLSHATNALFITSEPSEAFTENGLAEVRALPSFFHLLLRLGLGREIPRTVDYQTSPGVIFLAHQNAKQIQDDYRRIRQLEQEGLFEPA